MAVLSFDIEVAVEVPPAAMFDRVVKLHEIVVEIGQGKVKNAGVVQGDGGVGTITQMELVDDGLVKERLDFLDKEALEAKFTVIEGSGIGTKLQATTYDIKITPASTGSICKAHAEYTPLPGADFKEEDLDIPKLKVTKMFEAVAGYISAKA